MSNLTNNKIIFLVHESFFLEKSYLMTAHDAVSISGKAVLRATFIPIVSLESYYFHVAELCRSLGVHVILHKVVLENLKRKTFILINYNC